MIRATTIYKGKVIAEEEFELFPKLKGKQKKLSEYITEQKKDDCGRRWNEDM